MDLAHQIDSDLHRVFLENVKARRQELDLTQSEVAEIMGVAQPTYAHIESGRNIPTLGIVERVAKALRTSSLQLLFPQALTAR